MFPFTGSEFAFIFAQQFHSASAEKITAKYRKIINFFCCLLMHLFTFAFSFNKKIASIKSTWSFFFIEQKKIVEFLFFNKLAKMYNSKRRRPCLRIGVFSYCKLTTPHKKMAQRSHDTAMNDVVDMQTWFTLFAAFSTLCPCFSVCLCARSRWSRHLIARDLSFTTINRESHSCDKRWCKLCNNMLPIAWFLRWVLWKSRVWFSTYIVLCCISKSDQWFDGSTSNQKAFNHFKNTNIGDLKGAVTIDYDRFFITLMASSFSSS